MAYAQRFEDLEIWQRARTQVSEVYREVESCPDFAFKNQIRRACLSVMNNIAEGFERRTRQDFAHFLDIAKASNGELRSMSYAAEDLGYIDQERALEIRRSAEDLSVSIAAFARHVRSTR